MVHYGGCSNEPFEFAEIQNVNTAIQNSLSTRRRSFTWPNVLIEDGLDSIKNEVSMQEDIILIKTEPNLDQERFLMDSPLPGCVISPEQSPGMESTDLSQPQVISGESISLYILHLRS